MSPGGLAMREASLLLGGVLLCGAMVAMAQAPTQLTAVNQMSGPYRIAGVLVNAATGEPVRRATIEALKADDSHAVALCVTDSDGRFALDRLAAAKYQLAASKRGFRSAFYDEHDQFSSAIVTGPDQDTTHLEFKLTQGAVVRGVVTSDDGEPVADARVMLFKRPQFPAAGERTVQADASATDDTGAYEFSDLAAGEYLLAVVAQPWYAIHEGAPARRNAALDVAYPVTYFDSTTEEGSATPIVLAGGSHQEANVSLHAVPALRLAVPVSRKPDSSVVLPQLQSSVFGNDITTDGNDLRDPGTGGLTMEFTGIAPGHYQLTQFDPPRVVDLDLTSNQQMDANAGSAALSVEGQVRMTSAAPLTEEITVSLQRADGGPGQSLYAAPALKGRFRFDAVPPGEWVVMATDGDRALPVVAVSAGGVQRAGNVVTLKERASELQVMLSGAVTRVEGFAQKDGKGFAGAMIVLLPKNRALWKALTRRDQSDSDGSFALPDVAPGNYTAIAIEDGWALDWTSPDAMARYLSDGTTVTITEQSGALIRLSSPVLVRTR